jgi:radical SAM-linked protein
MVRPRARIRFRKQGDLRLIGHRDLVRLLERLFRRAGIGLAMSQGFHPKPRMSFPSALALGIEGLDEVMELELAEPSKETSEVSNTSEVFAVNAEILLSQLTRHSIPGLSFAAVEMLPPGAKKAQLRSTTYQLPVPGDRCAATADRIAAFCGERPDAESEAPVSQAILVRQSLEEIRLEDGILRFRLRTSRQRSAGPRDVLTVLGLDDAERLGGCLTRTEVQLQSSDAPPAPDAAFLPADACSPTLPG